MFIGDLLIAIGSNLIKLLNLRDVKTNNYVIMNKLSLTKQIALNLINPDQG